MKSLLDKFVEALVAALVPALTSSLKTELSADYQALLAKLNEVPTDVAGMVSDDMQQVCVAVQTSVGQVVGQVESLPNTVVTEIETFLQGKIPFLGKEK